MPYKDPERQRENQRRKQKEKGWKMHAWDPISDVCERCGLQRRRKADLKRFGMFIDSYLVEGNWIDDRPLCLSGTLTLVT